MSLKTLFVLVTLALTTIAAPSYKAKCSNGRTASDAAVSDTDISLCLLGREHHIIQCCTWFDVMDDIQQNL